MYLSPSRECQSISLLNSIWELLYICNKCVMVSPWFKFICVFLIPNEIDPLFICWPFGYSLLWNAFSYLLPIFLLDCVFFFFLLICRISALVYYMYCKYILLRWHFEQRPEGSKGVSRGDSWMKVLQVEWTAITKTSRWEYFWNVAGATKDAYLSLGRSEVRGSQKKKKWSKMKKKPHGVLLVKM